MTCPNCTETFTPPPKAKPNRRLPTDAAVVSYLNARGGTAKLRDIARRFHLDAAQVNALVGRLQDARLGKVYQRPVSLQCLSRRPWPWSFTLLREPPVPSPL